MKKVISEQTLYLDLIEASRERIEAGDGDALLNALLHLCMSDSPMPEWFSYHVADAVRKYTHHRVKSLDEAFGVTRPKSYQSAPERQRITVGRMIYIDLRKLYRAGFAMDAEAFELVGKLYGVGRRKVADYHAGFMKIVGTEREGGPISTDALPERLRELVPHLKKRARTRKANRV